MSIDLTGDTALEALNESAASRRRKRAAESDSGSLRSLSVVDLTACCRPHCPPATCYSTVCAGESVLRTESSAAVPASSTSQSGATVDLTTSTDLSPGTTDSIITSKCSETTKRRARSPFSCGVCLEDNIEPSLVHTLAACFHRYCTDCLMQLVRSKVGDRRLDQLVCPEPKCRRPLQVDDVRRLTLRDRDTFDAYTDMATTALIESKVGAFCACPRCGLVAFLPDDDVAAGIRARARIYFYF